jgi:hypothetical protein
MSDLYGALLAAAGEAQKMQEDLEQTSVDLRATRELAYELEAKNRNLENKFKKAGELMAQLTNLFMSE